jgi:hypothetical protein
MSTAAYMGGRAVGYVLPWVVAFLAMPVALLVYVFIRPSTVWVALTTLMFCGLAFSTWKFWAVRRRDTQYTALVFCLAVLGWVLFAGVTKPWSEDALRAWIIGGFGGSAAWCIRHAALGGVNEQDSRKQAEGDNRFTRLIGAMKGARMSAPKATENQVSTRVTLDAPTVVGDLQRSKEQIAGVAGVEASQVSIVRVPGTETEADLIVTARQDTSKPVVYTGPSAPGQSIAAAPVYLGRRVDSSDIGWWIVGSDDPVNPRPLAHTKCTGMTGAGKTETLCTAILDMRWRTDVVPVVGDPAKFRQSFGDIEECLGLAATNREQVHQLLENLAGPVIEYRSELLGSLVRSDGGTGYKQWVPECWTLHRVPAVFVDIEEAADVVMGRDEEVYEALRKLRSLGVHLCLSMQTMPHDDIPRKVRGQIAQSLVHGAKEFQDVKYALEPETIEAGADPTKWANNAPGSLYAEVTGTDRKHWSQDGRAVYMTAAQKQMSLSQSRQYWAEMDSGTYARMAYGITVAPIDDVEDDADQAEYEKEEAMTAGEVDPMQPIAPPRAGLDIQFSDAPEPVKKMSTEQARERLQNRLEVLARSGVMKIKAADLADLPGEVGRSPGWLYENLGLLAAAGVLRELRPPEGGVFYEIVKQYPEAV